MRDLAGRAEMIHAWSSRAGVAARTLARWTGRPAVLSWPSLPSREDLSLLSRLAGRAGRASRPGRSIRSSRAVRIIVPTEVAKTALLWAGIDDSAVSVLAPPAASYDQADVADRRRRLRAAMGIGPDQRLLVAPAEMMPGAGHKYACWAHAIVRQIVADVLLLMPCDGPSGERVRYFAGTTGYDDEIFFREDCPAEFAGPDGRLARIDALAAADVVLFLGQRDTGLSALAEAMSAGRAIAASNTPDTAECVPAGQAGLLSPACDPRAAAANVLKLVEDRRLAAELGAAARRLADERFAVPAAKARLAEIYAAAPS